MTKKKSKAYDKSRKRLVIAFIIFIGLVSVLFGSIFSDWGQILNNKKQIKSLNAKYEVLKEESLSLQSEVNKLQDEEYVARYAREKFLYSKEGEIILRIPGIDKNKEEEE